MELLEKYFDIAFDAPDGIKRLRELILTLAMQGKLVPQDQNEPSASELLKEIAAEKQRLVKNGTIKKPKPLSEIKSEEVPYKLPHGWEWVRLGDIGIIGSSSRVHQNDWRNSGVPFYRAREIVKLSKQGFVDNELFITEELYQSLTSSGLSPAPGDLMITGVGTIGVPYVVKEKDRFYFKDASVLIFKNQFKIFPLFLSRFFESHHWISSIHKESMGTTVHTLTIVRANEATIPLPPIPEQHRIVAKIEQLMTRCDELETLRFEREQKRINVHVSAVNRLLSARENNTFIDAWQFISKHFGDLHSVKENVTELRKAILQLAVMGKLVPQDPSDVPANKLFEELEVEKKRLVKSGKIKASKPLSEINHDEVPYQLPKGWIWARLNDVLDVRDGTHDTPKYVDVGYPLITSKNLYTGKLSFEDIKYISEEDHKKISERSKVDVGDILFAMIGSIGNPVIVDSDAEFSIKNMALFKFYQTGVPDNRFLHYFLIHAQENMKAISSGAVQSFVSLGFLRSYLFPLPPLAEQARIVAKIDRLMACCDDLDQQIDKASFKQTQLLNALISQV